MLFSPIVEDTVICTMNLAIIGENFHALKPSSLEKLKNERTCFVSDTFICNRKIKTLFHQQQETNF